ncbi:MAG TPA: hypothetical protein VNM45_11475 [Bacillus sp. (in: firmicutes)]|nr:hypothetical protein [Bacillus sp. (in: firmicutes)]
MPKEAKGTNDDLMQKNKPSLLNDAELTNETLRLPDEVLGTTMDEVKSANIHYELP